MRQRERSPKEKQKKPADLNLSCKKVVGRHPILCSSQSPGGTAEKDKRGEMDRKSCEGRERGLWRKALREERGREGSVKPREEATKRTPQRLQEDTVKKRKGEKQEIIATFLGDPTTPSMPDGERLVSRIKRSEERKLVRWKDFGEDEKQKSFALSGRKTMRGKAPLKRFLLSRSRKGTRRVTRSAPP